MLLSESLIILIYTSAVFIALYLTNNYKIITIIILPHELPASAFSMNNSDNNSQFAAPFILIVTLTLIVVVFIYNKPANQYPENWIAQWKMGKTFQFPRRALASVEANGHLYVIGGVDEHGQYVKSVEFAKLGKNGDIGPWQTTSALNVGRFYLAAVVVNNSIFALGGGSGPVGDDNYPIASVEMATIQKDGTLGKWQVVSNMRLPRRGLKAVALDNHIYAIGGYSGIFLKSIEQTTVNSDGMLGSWQIDEQQAVVDRYIHSAALHKHTLYLLGGHVQRSDQMSYGDVESSQINASGFLSPWSIEKSRLLIPRFIASAFAVNQNLYIAGGHNGSNRLKNVEFAPIYSNGRVGQWRKTTPLNIPRSAAASVVTNDRIYVLGGIGDHQVLNSVEIADISPNGHLGHIRNN